MKELLVVTNPPLGWSRKVMNSPTILSEKTSQTIVDSSGFRSAQVVVTF
jgi:hypothetical protein